MTSRRGFLAALVALPLGVRAIKAVGPERPPFYLPPITAKDRRPNLMMVASETLAAGQLVVFDEDGYARRAVRGVSPLGVVVGNQHDQWENLIYQVRML